VTVKREQFDDETKTADLMLDFSGRSSSLGTAHNEVYLDRVHDLKSLLYSYTLGGVNAFMANTGHDVIESCSEINSRNMDIARSFGLRPIALFRQGERFYWLDKMIVEGEDYVGLLPMVGASAASKRSWLDKCFTMLTDVSGKPVTRVHGFGVNEFSFMQRYPWFSIDSKLWFSLPDLGLLFVPRLDVDGHPVFSKRPVVVKCSSMGSFLSGMVHEHLVSYLEDRVGVTLSDVVLSASSRRRAMLYFLNRFSVEKDLVFRHRLTRAGPRSVHNSLVPLSCLRIMHTTFLKPTLSLDLAYTKTKSRHLPLQVASQCTHDVLTDYLQTYGV
jgi:hypothetical protein